MDVVLFISIVSHTANTVYGAAVTVNPGDVRYCGSDGAQEENVPRTNTTNVSLTLKLMPVDNHHWKDASDDVQAVRLTMRPPPIVQILRKIYCCSPYVLCFVTNPFVRCIYGVQREVGSWKAVRPVFSSVHYEFHRNCCHCEGVEYEDVHDATSEGVVVEKGAQFDYRATPDDGAGDETMAV